MLFPPNKLLRKSELPYGCSTVGTPSVSTMIPAGSLAHPSTPSLLNDGPQLLKYQPKD